MIRAKKRLAAAVLAAAGLLAVAVPTTASAADGDLTFWSGAFTGQTVTYPDAGTGCTTLPFVVHAELNETATGIRVYESTDCTGRALTFPATDVHSFIGFDGRSFEPVG